MKKLSIVLFILLLFNVSAPAQHESDKLTGLARAWRERISKALPGWTVRTIEPIQGSKGVFIEQWESADVTMKIALTEYERPQDAALAMNDFKNQLKTQEEATRARGNRDFELLKAELSTLGNGGLVWDIQGSEATAFRKGRYLVFVSMAQPKGYNDVALSREFAGHVVEALPSSP